MISRKNHFDIAVIGAGSAGTAAAIHAALKGLTVILVDSYPNPRPKPGESLPPGIEIIFRQLGIWETINSLMHIRHSGYFTLDKVNNKKIFHPYGKGDEKWYGFQIMRHHLDSLLQERAKKLGVTFLLSHHINKFIVNRETFSLMSNNNHPVYADYYIDATGSSHLFARKMGIQIISHTQKLIARYGYLEQTCLYKDLPVFITDCNGWKWYAKIADRHYAWVSLNYQHDRDEKPCRHEKISGGADVTWRIASQLAGERFFLTGDAACVLDPSAGHGVLRAMMTGILSADIIYQIKNNYLTPQAGYRHYHRWLNNWFLHDRNELLKHYRGVLQNPSKLSGYKLINFAS